MTQVVRQKWLLLLTGLNGALALTALLLIGLAASDGRRDAEAAASTRDAELRGVRAELAAVRGELEGLHGLRASLDELKSAAQRDREPRETELTRTLQLLAAEQQLLYLQALQPPVAASSASKSAARRTKSRRRAPARAVCPVK